MLSLHIIVFHLLLIPYYIVFLMVLLNNILLYFFVFLPFFHSNSSSKNIKKTEYFFNIEILCNIDDYCILFTCFCGWKFLKLTGVDLNLQFPAGWEQAKEIKYSQGFTSPAPRDFVGYGPLTEPESLAVYNFTLRNNFRLVISYHTQGQEIYWNFQNINPPNGYQIGTQFANANGYTLANVPFNSSFAGYKDWFIQNYNRPGYTIEAGLGNNPLSISQFNEIYNDNIGILVLGAIL